MKKILIIIFLMALSKIWLYADTFSLEQVRTLALANSRSLERINMALRTSIINERNHLYTMLPEPTARYDASMNYLQNEWEGVNPLDTFRTGLTLSVTQKIFEGGKSFVRNAINKISTENVRNDMLSEYFNVLDSADNAYYAVLEADATLRAAEASLQIATLSHSMAEIRHVNGMINHGDYLRALAEKESRENSRNQARRNLALNIMKLRILTGNDEIEEIQEINFGVNEELLQFFAKISDEEADLLYNRFWAELIKTNPSLAKAALTTQIAEKNLSITKRDLWPTISATVFSTTFDYSSNPNPAFGGYSNSTRGGVTISGTIPIDFWITRNNIIRSKITRDSSMLDYIDREISLETDLQSTLISAFSNAGSVLSSRLSVEYAEKHVEFEMERYRLSLSSVSDLSEALALLITNQNTLIRSKYGFLQSLSRLRSLIAIDDEEILFNLLIGR